MIPMGYIVMCAPKKKATAQYFAPLAYGKDGQPDPTMLLSHRGATLFTTEDRAWDALRDTLTAATEQGHIWPANNHFGVIKVFADPYNGAGPGTLDNPRDLP